MPIALAKPTQSPKSSRNVPAAVALAPVGSQASADLLGLCSPVSTSAQSSTTNGTKSEAAEVVGDLFSNFLSGPSKSVSSAPTVNHSPALSNPANVSLAKQEEDFFNQVAPTEQEKGKMTRDSIMALYAKTPTSNSIGGQFNGVVGGFNQLNGHNGFMSHPQTQQGPTPIGGFTNSQLLSQLGSTVPSAFGSNGNQAQQTFANFGTPVQQQHQPPSNQIPPFAHFPPMGGAAPPSGSAGFPLNNGFGSQSAGSANNGAGLHQQFANLNMWQ